MPCISWLCYARVRGYFGFVGDGRFNWPFPVAFEIIPVVASYLVLISSHWSCGVPSTNDGIRSCVRFGGVRPVVRLVKLILYARANKAFRISSALGSGDWPGYLSLRSPRQVCVIRGAAAFFVFLYTAVFGATRLTIIWV
ncbi:hypothetical protein BDZ89DRAFT_1039309 [Hymenopellis radicata]|nr:hypothetical protein BDZ89DRAFT_1039309 [Hymenopellis radicata]